MSRDRILRRIGRIRRKIAAGGSLQPAWTRALAAHVELFRGCE